MALPLLWAAATAQAQVDLREIDRQNQVFERQQQELLRQQQERALQQAPRTGTDILPVQPPIAVPDLGVKCRDIREIRISGAALLPDEVRRGLVRDYADRCLGVSELEAILATLTKSYIDRGYITTRAYLPAQDLRTGVLEITVIEGSIERFQLEQSGRNPDSTSIRGAFPARPGDLLNLRDLEQGIDQLNSLSSNSATLDIQPGTRPGESVVVVRNQAGFPVNLFATYDNLGTPSTGRDAASATLSFDSLLGLNEVIAITRRQSVPHDSEHNSNSTALHAAVPFGYYTFAFDASESNYVNTLQLPSGQKLASEGTTSTQSLLADRVIYRDQASRLSLSGRLTTQDSRNFLGHEFLAVGSRKLSPFDIGLSGFTQAAGGIANGRLAYVRGLKVLGAMEDPDDLPADFPHAQFDKITLDLGFNRRFDVAGRPLLLSSQFSGQHSGGTLYGSQQILIGGPGSVRGFMLNTLSGDSGYYLHNDLSLPWTATLGGQAIAGRVYAGYDFGSVTNQAPGVPSGSMSGVTLGVAFQWRGLSADLFASRAAHLPGGMPSEGTIYSIRLSYSL
ncbi:ShlB/FhaC/HecB family hemolysin secretion/activation protein [Variovorax sp. J22P168]|uniref:ShlB/FhaC/HecB family hemolysin secretion/activation protein n=1 Tax=Variovorax jilinensis TaxID=3053513 RepID=UPI0025767690|nr:ShlB/FhaC/HecB family hemolysin secretion/activation protein [Variovorax sp. J22P168]MDM0014711.1 ShlB/FhaC/HecB family hemolysin secretion/activation protein [Variovorax sp. J22P168]